MTGEVNLLSKYEPPSSYSLGVMVFEDIFTDLVHRFPLYYLTVIVGLSAARTLLERFRTKSYDFNTQIKHVSRHPGT